MENIENVKSEEEKHLERQLIELPKKKWGVLKLILIGIIGPFLLPYIPMRRGSMWDKMGYEDAVLSFGLIYLAVIPFACYMHFQKVNEEIFEVERKLRHLRFKQKESEESNN